MLKNISYICDVISVTRHIEYLITCNDCVILPGWGAFLAHSCGAVIAEDGLSILPPTRTVSFNPDINHNDGLVVTSIMRREGVTYETALKAVEDYVASLRHQLESEHEIVFPRIGQFSLPEETHTVAVFNPASDSLAAAPYCALPKVHLHPLEEISADNISSDSAANTGSDDHRTGFILPLKLRKAMRVAAASAAILALGAVLTTPVIVDNHSLFASVDPSAALPKVTGPKSISVTPPTAYESASEFIYDDNFSGTLSIAIPAEEDTAHSMTEVASRMPHRYFLVVASLVTTAQAEKFIAASGDSTLRILKQDGRARVYAASGATLEEAQQLKSDRSFRDTYPDAWVYKQNNAH